MTKTNLIEFTILATIFLGIFLWYSVKYYEKTNNFVPIIVTIFSYLAYIIILCISIYFHFEEHLNIFIIVIFNLSFFGCFILYCIISIQLENDFVPIIIFSVICVIILIATFLSIYFEPKRKK
jgi:hypothetical protein